MSGSSARFDRSVDQSSMHDIMLLERADRLFFLFLSHTSGQKKSILDLLRDKQMSSILQGINEGGKPPWARRDAFALTETWASREKTNGRGLSRHRRRVPHPVFE